MKMVIVTILDTAAGAYGRPAFWLRKVLQFVNFKTKSIAKATIISFIDTLMIFSYSIWVLLMIILVQWIY